MIEKVLKIQILIPESLSKELLKQLAKFGFVDFQETLRSVSPNDISQLKKNLEIVESLDHLIKERKKELGKTHPSQFISFVPQKLKELEKLKSELEALKKKIEEIRKIKNLNYSSKLLFQSKFFNFYLIEGQKRDHEKIQQELKKDLIFEEVFSEKESLIYLYGIFKEKSIEFKERIKKYNLKEIKIPDFSPKEKFQKLNEEKNQLESEINILNKEIEENLPSQKDWEDFKKYLEFEFKVNSILLKSKLSEKFSLFSGWIPERHYDELKKNLEKKFKFILIEKVPFKPEEAPVLLNNKFSKIFEIVTKLYGFPKPTEIDPTPFLAPFFVIFFGFSLSDAGYGLIMTLAGLILMSMIKKDLLKFFGKLLLILGISTTIFGVLFGTFFGKDIALFINPTKEPFRVLAICFFFAMVQISLGYFLSFLHLIKNGKSLINSFADNLSLVPVLILFSLIFIQVALSIDLFSKSLFFKLIILFLALKFVLHLIAERNILKGIIKAFSSFYNVISLLSDTLSYSRIYALGLATGVIASTVNLLSIILKDMVNIPIISFLIFIFLLIFGHLFSIVINIWGAFLHSARLQLVEFFSKFLEGGGRPFQPLKYK
jgi:V/A-type H+-transporting ATPase subunit I